MSKILTNTVKKTSIWTVVLTYILAAAVAFGIVFGMKGYGVFNKNVTLDNAKTLTISMNQYAYLTALEEVEDVCEEVFGLRCCRGLGFFAKIPPLLEKMRRSIVPNTRRICFDV